LGCNNNARFGIDERTIGGEITNLNTVTLSIREESKPVNMRFMLVMVRLSIRLVATTF